jgi:hypothetical protein
MLLFCDILNICYNENKFLYSSKASISNCHSLLYNLPRICDVFLFPSLNHEVSAILYISNPRVRRIITYHNECNTMVHFLVANFSWYIIASKFEEQALS